MSRPRLALVVLALAALAAVGLRLGIVEAKGTLSHDESISYLASTCHQAEYEQIVARAAPPVARWAHARDWQRLFEPEEALCFGVIADGLALYDIHPPLYFWMLHVWTLAVGTGVASGALLNLGLVLLTMLALFGLARHVLRDRLDAALAASLWSVSPAVVAISSEARQYDLLALLCVLCVWQALRLAEAPPGRTGGAAALLGLAVAAGALTHYHFALVAIAVLGLLALRLRRARAGVPRAVGVRRVALGLGAVAAGYAVFYLAHPTFLASFSRQEGQASSLSPSGFALRVDRTLSALAEFLAGKLETPGLAAGVAALVVALAATAAVRSLRGRGTDGGRSSGPAASIVAMLAWLAGATIVLYLAAVSPLHAMGGRYLAMAWPFLSLAVVVALRARDGVRRSVAVVLLVLCAGFSTVEVLEVRARAGGSQGVSALSAEREPLVLDTVRRGILPAALQRLPEQRPVFAAEQRTLLDRQAEWLPGLGREAAFASTLSYGGEHYPQRRLLSTLGERLGRRRKAGSLRLWDSARPSGLHVVSVYRFAEARSKRRSNGRPVPGRQPRKR